MGPEPRKLKSSAVENIGVNFIRSIIEADNNIFHEIDRKNDFGVDGIVEFVLDEVIVGRQIALQIKSGKTYVLKSKCRIQASKAHFEYWSTYPMPVYVVVFDKAELACYWFDVSYYLKSDPDVISRGPYTVSFDKTELNKITEENFSRVFKSLALGRPPELSHADGVRWLNSSLMDLHYFGMQSLFMYSRHEFWVWEMFHDILRERDPGQTTSFICRIFALIGGHPDVFWGSHNIINEPFRTQLYELIRKFGVQELANLLAHIEEDGFERGGVGQDVDAVVRCVDGHIEKLSQIFFGEEFPIAVREAAMTLWTYYSGPEAEQVLQDFAKQANLLGEHARFLLCAWQEGRGIDLY